MKPPAAPEEPRLSILLVPESSRERWSVTLSYRRLRWLAAAAVVVIGLLALMAGSWWFLAARAATARALEVRVAELEVERGRMHELAEELAGLEAAYQNLRSLFGPDSPEAGGRLWLPPSALGASRPSSGGFSPGEAALPTSWPLTERGFVTQRLLAGSEGEHPGVDIAVPTGSYVRAAGAGTVVEAGDHPVYGHYLVVDHGNGYRSLYAHASVLLAAEGEEVRRNQVIGLTGSTGRSTAPHLHFEILLDGEPVDPFSMVRRP